MTSKQQEIVDCSLGATDLGLESYRHWGDFAKVFLGLAQRNSTHSTSRLPRLELASPFAVAKLDASAAENYFRRPWLVVVAQW
jgi:hypothetical protein